MKILIFIYIFCLSTSLFGDNNTLNTKATLDSLKVEQIRIKNNLKNIDNNIAKLLQNSNSESIESLAIKIDSIKINKDKYLSRLSIINIQVDSLTKHLTELILQKPIESFKGIIKQNTGLYKNPIQSGPDSPDRITTVTMGEVVDIIDISEDKYFVKINYNDNTGFVHVSDILTDKEKLSELQSRADAVKKSKDFENKKISNELSEKQNKSAVDHSKRDDLQLLYDSGLLKKLDADLNKARIDVYIWNSLDYDTKVGIGITLAKICDRAGSTGRITFYDNRSGEKVARYSQSYGYKSY